MEDIQKKGEPSNSNSIGGIIRKPGSDYKEENIHLSYLSSLTIKEAKALIGKTVAKIESYEYRLVITFKDGSTLNVEGATPNFQGQRPESLETQVNIKTIKLNIVKQGQK